MSTQSTMPPPETPRMSARHDSAAPRAIAYAGPESRYHRLRREAAAASECDSMRPCDGSGRRGDGQEFCSCPAGDRAEDDFSEAHGYPRFRGTKRAPSALEAQLSASIELIAAIEAIRIVECHALPHGTLDVCGEPLDTRCCSAERFEDPGRDCVLVYALDIGTIVYARTVEDAALELLLTHDAQQDQSPAAVARVVAMIRASFARAAQKAGT